MTKSYEFAADVVRTICDRLATKADELKLLTDTKYSFEEWINWEAFLALKPGELNGQFCEVAAKPCYTYAHEGIVGDDGKPFKKSGDLLVGGPNDGSDHCWLFAEFVLIHDDTMDKWQEKIEGDKQKLLRLNWKKSASLLIFVITSKHNVLSDWSEYLADIPTWNQPALIEPVVITLPGGGTVVVKAVDIKRDPKDVLTHSTT